MTWPAALTRETHSEGTKCVEPDSRNGPERLTEAWIKPRKKYVSTVVHYKFERCCNIWTLLLGPARSWDVHICSLDQSFYHVCTIKCALINPSACGVHCANVRLESAATHVSSDLSSVHHYSPIGHSWCLCPPSDLHAFLHVSVLYACYLKCKGDTVFPRSALGLCPTIHLLIKVKPCHTCGHTHKEHVATCAVIFLSPWFFFFIGSPSFLTLDNERLSVLQCTLSLTLNLVCFLC